MAASKATRLVYEKADYHRALRATDPPKVSRRGKSKCPGDLTPIEAQELLNLGYREGQLADGTPKAVFVRRGGIWYRAMVGNRNRYHGAPVDEFKVPPDAKRQADARWMR